MFKKLVYKLFRLISNSLWCYGHLTREGFAGTAQCKMLSREMAESFGFVAICWSIDCVAFKSKRVA
jgi:hypothetical protein